MISYPHVEKVVASAVRTAAKSQPIFWSAVSLEEIHTSFITSHTQTIIYWESENLNFALGHTVEKGELDDLEVIEVKKLP